MYVKSTFMNWYLKEEVSIKKPLGYWMKGQEDKVLIVEEGNLWVNASTKSTE